MVQIWRVMAAQGGMLRAMVLAALVLLAGAGLLMLSGWFISASALAGMAGAGVVFDVFRPAASVRGLALLRTVARYGERMLGHDATLRAVAGLRAAVLGGLAALPWPQMQQLRRGPALARIIADTDVLDGLPLRLVLPAVAGLVALLASFGLIAWLAVWPLALWVVGVHLVVALAAAGWGLGRARVLSRALGRAERDYRSHTLDLVAARDDLLVYGRLQHQTDRAIAAEQHAASLSRALERVERDTALIQELGRLVAMAGALGLGARGVALGLFDPAIAAMGMFAAMALAEVTAPLRRAIAEWGRISDAASRVAPMLRTPAQVLPAQATATPAALPLQIDDQLVLPGQMLALSGPSGAGKSTLLARIAGLLPAADHQIRLGGRDITDWPEAELRAVLTLVPQRPAFVAGTLRDNLCLAAPDAPDRDLLEMLAAMRLDHLPGGLDLRLSDGARALSGGESRRLALARALLRKPQILLLDEPTEGMDDALAREVMQGITLLSKDISLVVASHRPADLILAAEIRSLR